MRVDNLSPDGVMALSKKITAYWETRGLEVQCRAVKIKMDEDVKVIPSNLWSLRSNLRFDRHGNPYTVDELA